MRIGDYPLPRDALSCLRRSAESMAAARAARQPRERDEWITDALFRTAQAMLIVERCARALLPE